VKHRGAVAAKILLLGGVILILNSTAFSFTFGIKGFFTVWLTANAESLSQPFFGIRYIPEFTMEKALSDKYTIDFELSLNAYGTAHVRYLNDVPTDGDIDLYRLWGRFSSSRFEARIGLQKINFGSASLLRPLMWFDRIDPRDPQATEVPLPDPAITVRIRPAPLDGILGGTIELGARSELTARLLENLFLSLIPSDAACSSRHRSTLFPSVRPDRAGSTRHGRFGPGRHPPGHGAPLVCSAINRRQEVVSPASRPLSTRESTFGDSASASGSSS